MIPDPVGSSAERAPSAPAIVEAGGRSLSAAELEATVAGRAGGLRAGGVGPGHTVGIPVTDRFRAVVDLLSVVRAGGVASIVDGSLDPDRLEARLASVGADRVLHRGPDPPFGAAVEAVDPPDGAPPIDAAPLEDDRVVTAVETSGTTGEPTAVRHTAWNHAAAAVASAGRLGVEPGDRWYDPLPLSHMGGVAPVTRCLYAGIPLVVSWSVGGRGLFDRLGSTRSTIASVVPTMLVDALDSGVPGSDLRCVLVGGAPLRDRLFERADDAGVPVWPTYGMTETLGQVCTARPGERRDHPGTVGRPVAGVDLEVVDGDGAPIPTGEVGEVRVGGETVAPAASGSGRRRGAPIHTGDRGRLDAEGRLYPEGRVDDAIQTGGTTVRPATVEDVLAAHPDVEAAAVVGVPDRRWGEAVVAGVVPRGSTAIDVEAVRRFCRDRLRPAEVPRRIVPLAALPRTPSGTVDRPALRERFDGT